MPEFNVRTASYFAGIVLGIVISFKLLHSKKKKTKKVPHGVVLLHQIIRTHNGVPNMSPPCLKLETYLRMTKIPYECDFGFEKSSKGKVPWIEFNGKAIADSNFCIEFLSKEFGVDLDDHLSDEQKGIARAVLVMLEENTFRTLAHYRALGDGSETFKKAFLANFISPVRNLVFQLAFQKRVKRDLYAHGIGRHSVEEIYGIAEKDLKAVSLILGDKMFLFGDKPCLADVYLFGLVSNFIYLKPLGPQGKAILTRMKNLEEHTKRMKDAFYPDWDEIALEKEKVA